MMKKFLDRLTNKNETIKDPLYDNPFSYGRIVTDQNKCSGCGSCKANCVVEAVDITNGVSLVNQKKCIFCKNCIALCPNGALQMIPDYKMSDIEAIGASLKEKIYSRFNRSLTLRSVDTGSCNACMLELSATQNTYYDLSRFGINFAASPRHSDGIVVTGPVTINMKEALEKTYYAMAEPRLVIALGACGCDGGIFKHGYGNYAELSTLLPVDMVIPGCPPSPQAIIYGFFKLLNRL